MTSPSLETLVRAREAAALASRAKNPWVTDKQGATLVKPDNSSCATAGMSTDQEVKGDHSQSVQAIGTRSTPRDVASSIEILSSEILPSEIPPREVLPREVLIETLGAGVVTILGDAVALVVEGHFSSSQTGAKQVLFGAGQVIRGTTGVVIGLLGCLGCVIVCVGKTIIGSSRNSQA